MRTFAVSLSKIKDYLRDQKKNKKSFYSNKGLSIALIIIKLGK